MIKNTIYAICAGIIYGGWAYYVNGDITAMLIQGVLSFVSTLGLLSLIIFIMSLVPRKLAKTLAGSMVPNALLAIILITAHYLNGTANIIATVLPSLIVAFFGSLLYIRKELEGAMRMEKDGGEV